MSAILCQTAPSTIELFALRVVGTVLVGGVGFLFPHAVIFCFLVLLVILAFLSLLACIASFFWIDMGAMLIRLGRYW
jgi:hypothetical protein